MNEYFSKPKVTIDLDDYNRLKDIEYQVFGILKGKIETEKHEDKCIIGKIKKEDFDYYFKNLFNIDRLIIEGVVK